MYFERFVIKKYWLMFMVVRDIIDIVRSMYEM